MMSKEVDFPRLVTANHTHTWWYNVSRGLVKPCSLTLIKAVPRTDHNVVRNSGSPAGLTPATFRFVFLLPLNAKRRCIKTSINSDFMNVELGNVLK